MLLMMNGFPVFSERFLTATYQHSSPSLFFAVRRGTSFLHIIFIYAAEPHFTQSK